MFAGNIVDYIVFTSFFFISLVCIGILVTAFLRWKFKCHSSVQFQFDNCIITITLHTLFIYTLSSILRGISLVRFCVESWLHLNFKTRVLNRNVQVYWLSSSICIASQPRTEWVIPNSKSPYGSACNRQCQFCTLFVFLYISCEVYVQIIQIFKFRMLSLYYPTYVVVMSMKECCLT